MTVSAQPGCWGTAARLPNKPGSQKLIPFSSAKEMAGSEVTAPIASMVLVWAESQPEWPDGCRPRSIVIELSDGLLDQIKV